MPYIQKPFNFTKIQSNILLDYFSNCLHIFKITIARTNSSSCICLVTLQTVYCNPTITCSKSTTETLEKAVNMFKVNNEDIRTVSLLIWLWCPYCYLWTYFTPFSIVPIVDFEQVNACWVLIHLSELDVQVEFNLDHSLKESVKYSRSLNRRKGTTLLLTLLAPLPDKEKKRR